MSADSNCYTNQNTSLKIGRNKGCSDT